MSHVNEAIPASITGSREIRVNIYKTPGMMQEPSPHNAICRECEYAGRTVKPREFHGFDMRRVDRTANAERVAL